MEHMSTQDELTGEPSKPNPKCAAPPQPIALTPAELKRLIKQTTQQEETILEEAGTKDSDAPWTAGPAGAGSASSNQYNMGRTSRHAQKKQSQPSMKNVLPNLPAHKFKHYMIPQQANQHMSPPEEKAADLLE
eukprot:9879500-Ditylum_brightwellii.AAC.2